MSLTGKLGTSDSTLGDIQLGTASSTTANTADVSETVSISESAEELSTHLLGISETVSVSEAVTGSQPYQGDVAEEVTVSDVIVELYSGVPSTPETVSVSEAVDLTQEKLLGVSETVSVSDSVEGSAGRTGDVAEEVTVSDAIVELYSGVPSTPETVAVAEAVDLLQEKLLGTSETVSVSDAVEGSAGRTGDVAEEVTVSDAIVELYSGVPSTPETVSISETAGLLQEKLLGTSETVSVSDSVEGSAGYIGAVNETASISEAVGIITGFGVAESVSVSDALTAVQGAHGTIAETVSVSEGISNSGTGSVLLSETVSGSSSAVATHGNVIAVSESAGVSEALGLIQALHNGVSETVVVSDATGLLSTKIVGVTETAGISEAGAASRGVQAALAETVPITDLLSTIGAQVSETVVISDAATTITGRNPTVSETIATSATVETVLVSGYHISVEFTTPLARDWVTDATRYHIEPTGDGVPLRIEGIDAVSDVLDTGSAGLLGALDAFAFSTHELTLDGVSLSTANVGQYVTITGPASSWNIGQTVRIVSVPTSTRVIVAEPLLRGDPQNGSLQWRHESGVKRVILATNKLTNGQPYSIAVGGLYTTAGLPYAQTYLHIGNASKPRISDVAFLPEGDVLVTFAEPMRSDSGFVDPADYTITGPTTPIIHEAKPVSDRSIRLTTTGIGPGSYTLTINPLGTPHDLAGNPIDPTYNAAVFTGSTALNVRSIFTDKGPIAKPPLTMQSGTGITIHSPTEITCTGGVFGSGLVGKYLKLSGTTLNGGSFRILEATTTTRLRIAGNLRVPETASVSWSVVDPREGVIADSPLDVVVRVNGTPVIPEAVSGLRGQVVLQTAPAPTDDVKISYSWVDSPTVEIRGLNSPQFVLNGGQRDNNHLTQHGYKYRCVLIRPDEYVPVSTVQSGTTASVVSTTQVLLPTASLTGANVGQALDIVSGVNAGTYTIASITGGNTVTVLGTLVYPDAGSGTLAWSVLDFHGDISASINQPTERDVKYRAYERAYSAVMNDPNLLVLNTPSQRIAYPPLSRIVETSFVSYEALSLPELDTTAPWNRVGSGSASVVDGQLVVTDTSSSPFPSDSQIYWTRPVDLTFEHAFAATWRFQINADPVEDGIYTGVSIGYSNEDSVFLLGFLDDAGVKKIGVLKKDFGADPSSITAWAGGVDGSGSPTGLPVAFDWSVPHSYRIYRNKSGTIRVYVDGEVSETLRQLEIDLPFLEELPGPFNALEGIFFGALSRAARSTSTWDFIRYTVIPTNPKQTAPSSFTNYEGNNLPETATPPWTPVGAHGTETVVASSSLRLDSTSATTSAVESETGLVGGDFRGFVRMEPLLSVSADIVLDVNVKLLTYTHGIAPNAVMAAVDDGSRLMQLSFFPDKASAKYSYGGRQLPETWAPVPWVASGAATTAMRGRVLRITDASTTDGRVYSIDDALGVLPLASGSYAFEFRAQVVSYTADVGGYCGVTADAYNGSRVVGVMLRQISGVRYVTFHSDGTPLAGGDIAFEWFDGQPHTFKFVVNIGTDLVVLFVDGTLVGSIAYTLFTSPAPAVPVVSWGSATASSVTALSVVDWHYANVWRVNETPKTYVGIWKGIDPNSLTGYHLPLRASGRSGGVLVGNAFGDPAASFVSAGVAVGDYLVIDYGSAKGEYQILSVAATTLTLDVVVSFPTTNIGDYRIPRRIDWTTEHRYRLVRDPGGDVALMLDSDPTPLIRLGYDHLNFPPSTAGIVRTLSGGLPAVVWGALDPTNISSTQWDFVRYGIVRPPGEDALVPPHRILNQRNVIASPEHLLADVAHPHTGYWSSSTGIPPQTLPDILRDLSPRAYTRLNDGTPPVPVTQTSEIRHPIPVVISVSGLNKPEDVLNTDMDFLLNDPATKIKLLVPDDVLYNSIQVIETSTGEADLIAPFDDRMSSLGSLFFTKELCLTYDGSILPESDTAAPTAWALESDNPAEVSASVFSGILTYRTLGSGTRTIYKNPTPLPDSTCFTTEFKFRIKLLNDASLGAGDSQVRFGFSAPGLTVALGLVTTPLGERYIYVFDLKTGAIVGGVPFDFLDGDFHDYRILYKPGVGSGSIELFIDG